MDELGELRGLQYRHGTHHCLPAAVDPSEGGVTVEHLAAWGEPQADITCRGAEGGEQEKWVGSWNSNE